MHVRQDMPQPRDFDGNTALSGAIHKRRLEVVKLLLKSGADVDGKYGSWDAVESLNFSELLPTNDSNIC